MVEWNFNNNNGQSLLEIIIAVTVSVITIMAAITVLILMLRITNQDVFLQTAVFLERKTIDNLTSMTSNDWQRILVDNLGVPITEGVDYHLIDGVAEGDFLASNGAETVTVDSVDYAVSFQVNSVNRDANGNIVASGGAADPSTKKVDFLVTWSFRGDPVEYRVENYVTRAANFTFHQTDWSGGAGNSFFNASSTIDFRSQPGEIKLNL